MEEMNWEVMCFQMITAAGEAKSNYMEALQSIKEKDFEQADTLIKDGDESYAVVHEMHTDLVQKECAGEKVEVSLLMTHVEDQMMSVEMIKIMVLEFYELYKKIYALSEEVKR